MPSSTARHRYARRSADGAGRRAWRRGPGTGRRDRPPRRRDRGPVQAGCRARDGPDRHLAHAFRQPAHGASSSARRRLESASPRRWRCWSARPTCARNSTRWPPTSPQPRPCWARPGRTTRVGRKIDFLCQEFNREANTLCSKSADIELDAHRHRSEGRRSSACGSRSRMSNDNDRSAIQRRGADARAVIASAPARHSVAPTAWNNDSQIRLSVSCTTRQKRPGERDGVDYRFRRYGDFPGHDRAQAVPRYAEVFGNYYGTPSGPVDEALSAGRDMLSTSNWQGTQHSRTGGRQPRHGLHPAALDARPGEAPSDARPGSEGDRGSAHGPRRPTR